MKKIVASVILFALAINVALPCTTVIVSGKNTVDGRPLLFKQRDTPALENKMVSFSDGKYSYVGLVNTRDSLNTNVWGGHNSAGFAIMNSASYNINPESASNEKRESSGRIMKLALQTCGSLSDFEHLLDSLPRPLYLSSNFGVIDAFGNGAYYETNNDGYIKFDVNDIAQAPLGYLIRTNFSFSGDRSRDKGLSRFQVATDLLYAASLNNKLSYDYLLHDVSRSLLHGITRIDLLEEEVPSGSVPKFAAFRDFIPRYLTASAIVVQGVKKGESPALTTTWTTLGFPLVTPSVPVLIDGGLLPSVLAADKTGKAPLNEWSLEVKKKLFSIERGEGNDYLNLTELLSKNGEGLYYKLLPVNQNVLNESDKYFKKWRQNNKVNTAELKEFYKWVDQYLTEAYSTVLK